MKSRKFISLLCAAAMTVSSFAGLTITASAAETYSYDGSELGGWTISNGIAAVQDAEGADPYLMLKGGGGSSRSGSITVTQSTGEYTIEFDSLIHGSDGMKNDSHYTQLAFGESSMADPATAKYAVSVVATRDSRSDYKINGQTVTGGQNKWTRTQVAVNGTTATVTVIDATGAKLVNGVETTIDAQNTAKIFARLARGDAAPGSGDGADPGYIYLDNVHIYSGAPETLSATGLRATADLQPAPKKVPETVAGAAPALSIPEKATATNTYTADFNSATAGTVLSLNKAAQDPKDIVTGLKAAIGNRPDGEEVLCAASIVDVTGGSKALRLAAGSNGSNGRGPRAILDDDLDVTTNETAVMAFSVYLSSSNVVTNAKERLYLLNDVDSVDGNGVARNVFAVITTEDIGNESDGYKYTSGSRNIGVHVEPDQWNTVVVAVTADGTGATKYRVFAGDSESIAYEADGRLNPAVLGENGVGTGEGNMTNVTHLPQLAIANSKSDDGTGGSIALIDNLLTYKTAKEIDADVLPTFTTGSGGGEGQPTTEAHSVTIKSTDGKTATVKTTEETPFDAVLIHAKYNNGALTSVKSYPVTGINATGVQAIKEADNATIATGDKLMVWDSLSGMVPYGVLTVTEGATEYGITTTGITNGTVTAEPAKATAGTKVTLTVKPNDGYKLTADSLKVKHGTETITPTAVAGAADKYQFDMPAADVTVEAAFEAIEYTIAVDDTVKTNVTTEPAGKATVGTEVTVNVTAPDGKVIDTVTVKDADNGPVDVTPVANQAGKYTFTMPAKNVTVSATFKDVQKYAITTTATGATVTYKIAGADAVASAGAQAAEGQEVEVIAVADAGKQVTEIKVTKTTGGAEVALTQNKFTMPAEAVTVTVTTEAMTDPTYEVAGTIPEVGVESVNLKSGANTYPMSKTLPALRLRQRYPPVSIRLKLRLQQDIRQLLLIQQVQIL